MRTCSQRQGRYAYYVSFLPALIEIYDDFAGGNTAMQNMRKALQYQVAHGLNAVQMEDDIILCNDFAKKCIHEIQQRPRDLIQFFSMRKDDLTIGSRYISGYKYLMNQCFYLPLHIAQLILENYEEFEQNRTDNRIGGTDSLVQYALKKHRLKYWNVVPNLIDHKTGVSAIDSRRSSQRKSLTFIG
jgi:hypothetical protein